MAFFLIQPRGAAPLLLQASTIDRATARAHKAHPQGLDSVTRLGVAELAQRAASGYALPVAARRRVAAHEAKARAQARKVASRAAAANRAREKAEMAREAQRVQENVRAAQEKLAKAAKRVPRAARKQVVEGAQQAARLAALPDYGDDSMAPWD